MDPVFVWIARISIGSLLTAAASHKLRHRAEFRSALEAYNLLPAWATACVARALPFVEAGLAAVCVAQLDSAYVGAFALLSVYTVAIAFNLTRGLRSIDCGCGGARQQLSYGLVARNALLLVTCLVAAAAVDSRDLTWTDGITISFGVSVLAFLYATLNQILLAQDRYRATVI